MRRGRIGSAVRGIAAAACTMMLASTPVAAQSSRPSAGAPAANRQLPPEIDGVLQSPHVSDRVSAWGRSVAEVRHDLARLGPGEKRVLAIELAHDTGRLGDAHTAERTAMYLVMVSLMREVRLFNRVIVGARP